jgi:WD40 repeat protein
MGNVERPRAQQRWAHLEYTTAFSPDGRALASSGFDKTVRLWRAPTWQEIEAAENHNLN